MKPGLQLKLSQHLTLTPQLQQSIKLLQLSTLELHEEVERMLQENPLLERAEGSGDYEPERHNGHESEVASAPEAHGESAPSDNQEAPADNGVEAAYDDVGDEFSGAWEGEYSRGGSDDDDEFVGNQIAVETTLQDHLIWQLRLSNLSERDAAIVRVLIDAVDDSGYLTTPLEELLSIVPPELGAELDDLKIALNYLQSMDPAGVGARDAAECLTLQLQALAEGTPYRALALATVKTHLALLAGKDYARLRRLLRCGEDDLREVQRLIQSLNPRPGSDFAPADTRYVVPDVIVRKLKGQWMVSLNQATVPKLRLNQMYSEILARNRDASSQQLAGQLQEAKWMIKNVQQRFETILRVSQAIVDRQRHFFDHGEVAMRPLVLREIADILGLHESTISRVTTQKYMMTPRGVFELKYFFGSHVATDTGGAASATAIRALIKQLIANEDAKKPLSDNRIAELLGDQGIVVARRTIAKYREGLQIPPANLRKAI